MAEQSAVNRSVVGSSPMLSAIYFGPLEKWLNSHAFHACIHGVMKYTLKEKLGYVKKHLEENVPLHEIERKYGLKAETLKYFCWLYKVHGKKAFQKEDCSSFN